MNTNLCECGHPICGTELSEHHGQYGCLHVIGPDPHGDGNILCPCKKANLTPNRIVFDHMHRAKRVYTPTDENDWFSKSDAEFLREMNIKL
jgi:hypothetical protein